MNIQSYFQLAEMSFSEKIVDAATVAIVGMGTVIVSLWVIGEVFTLLHRAFERREDINSLDASVPESIPSSPTDAHLVPILTAAATAAIGRRVVVRRITFLNRDTVSGWAEAGRASIQSSHNLRRNS